MLNNNKNCIIIITTLANIAQAKLSITSCNNFIKNYELNLVVIDQFEDDSKLDSIENCNIIYAYEIFDKNFYLNAFTFSEKEFTDYMSLVAIKYFLKLEYENIILTNHKIEVTKSITLNKIFTNEVSDKILLLHKNISSQKLDENTNNSVLNSKEKSNLLSFIFINNGPTVISFVNWCIRQFEFIYYNSWTFYLYKENNQIKRKNEMVTLESVFFKNIAFLDCYEPVFNWENCIKIHNLETDGLYRFDYFKDKTPISYVIKSIFSTHYTIADKNIVNPFNEKEILINHSAIYENNKTLPITTTMQLIYDRRVDLQNAFPNYKSKDREGFSQWFIHNAKKEFDLDNEYIKPIENALKTYYKEKEIETFSKKVLKRIKKQKANVSNYPFGVNLCGFICGDFGLAEATRLLAKTLDAANIPFTIISYTASAVHTKNNTEWVHKISNEFKYNTNIMLSGGGGGSMFSAVSAPDVYLGRYNISYLYWELPEYYEEWKQHFNFIDEIWTSSEFSQKSFMTQTDKPVKVMPLCMDVKTDKNLTRNYFNLPEDKFIFLMMYDVRSTQKRKNPQAAINAFINEFEANENAILAIKINAPKDWNGENELLNSVKHLKNILIINQNFDKTTVNTLIKCCDVYVSLHRSEGLGLGPAEAMYLGNPTIMTGWSGNMEYATSDNSCLVDYEIIELDKDYPPYKKGCHWAEPKIETASKYMRKLYEDKDFYNKIAKNGYKTMHEDFDGKVLGERIKQRLKETENKITDTVYNNLIR